MLYMVTFTINIPPMLAYIPYLDPMGYDSIRDRFFSAMPWSSDFLVLSMTPWPSDPWRIELRLELVPAKCHPNHWDTSFLDLPFPVNERNKSSYIHIFGTSWNHLEPQLVNSWMFGQPSYNLDAHEIPPAIYRNMPHAQVNHVSRYSTLQNATCTS